MVDGAACRVQRITLPAAEVTWTVLDGSHAVVGRAEEFLEFLRVQGSSPNTVKSYARALALWWTYLSVFGLAWDGLRLSDVGGFLVWLRTGDGPDVVSIEARVPRFSESTVSTRLRAVTSFYRFHEANGIALGGAQHPGGMQCKRVCAAGGQFLLQKNLIEGKGALPTLELRVERFAEPPRPHFHFTTSSSIPPRANAA